MNSYSLCFIACLLVFNIKANSDNVYNNEALLIDDLLCKQQAKCDVVNIILNTKAKKKFVDKYSIKLAIVVVVLFYLLYRLGKIFQIPKIQFPGFKFAINSRISSESQLTKSVNKLLEVTCAVNKQSQEICKNSSGSLTAKFDLDLVEAVEQQVEYAKKIGLEPDMTKFDSSRLPDSDQVPRGNYRLDQLIAKLIKHAKNIGLVPDMMQFGSLPEIVITGQH